MDVSFKIIKVFTTFSAILLLVKFVDGYDHLPGSKINLSCLNTENENIGSVVPNKPPEGRSNLNTSTGFSEHIKKLKRLRLFYPYDRNKRGLSNDSKVEFPYRAGKTSPLFSLSRKVRNANQEKSIVNHEVISKGGANNDTLELLEEFNRLESQFFKLQPNTSFTPLYKSLLRRIAHYSQTSNKSDISGQNRKVLSYLYTATLSKICGIDNHVEDGLVVDLKGHLDIVKNRVEELKGAQKMSATEAYRIIGTDSNLQDRIEIAQHFISTQVDFDGVTIIKNVENKTMALLNKTVSLQNSDKNHLGKLENVLALRMFLGVTKVATHFLGFVVHVGNTTQICLERLMKNVEFRHDISAEEINKANASLLIASSLADKIKYDISQSGLLFYEQLLDAEKQLTKSLENHTLQSLDDIKKKLSETQKNLQQEAERQSKSDFILSYKIYEMRQELNNFLANKTEYLENTKVGNEEKTKETHDIVKCIKTLLAIDNIPINFYNQIKADKTELTKVAEALKQADTKIKALAQFELSVYERILPTVIRVEDSVKIISDTLRNNSGTYMDVSAWGVQGTIEDVKFRMNQVAKGFDVEENVHQYLEKLNEGMLVIIEVCNGLEYYSQNVDLVTSIDKLTSANTMQISIENHELNDTVNNLQQIIRSNLVLIKYEQGLNAFKEHMFPFGSSYSSSLAFPPSLKSNDTDSLIVQAANNLQTLKNVLIGSGFELYKKHAKFPHKNLVFSRKRNDSSPLFVWKYESIKSVIPKLFEGKEVVIKADIRQSVQKNAVKFNDIAVTFRLANETLQRELETRLVNFQITMEHFGNSYYRCDSKLYTIPSHANVNIFFSYRKSIIEAPDYYNTVYEKLARNSPILSPYAMWLLKLERIDYGNFSSLAPFVRQEIDIELEGRGEYVNLGLDVCGGDLDNDFRLDGIIDKE